MTSFFTSPKTRFSFGARAPKQRLDPQIRAIAHGDIAQMARLLREAQEQGPRPRR